MELALPAPFKVPYSILLILYITITNGQQLNGELVQCQLHSKYPILHTPNSSDCDIQDHQWRESTIEWRTGTVPVLHSCELLTVP